MRVRHLCAMALLVAAASFGSLGAAAASGPGSPRPAKGDTARVVSDVARQWFKAQWSDYRAHFVSPDGRVVDNANGGVSHSEGQGYGLLLAETAGDAEGFALIWDWTRAHLQIRKDALFAWKWDPKRQAVGDRNTASDGDILIGWALAKAARRFGRDDYREAARRIAGDVMATAVRPSRFGPILLPGAMGFGARDQPDGPVVNPSYWVYPALSDFDGLFPGQGWEALRRTGLTLLDDSRFGPFGLPSDWVALGGPKPAPARSFKSTFGYDAIRIPLYLAWDPAGPRGSLARFADLSEPHVIDVATGAAGEAMGGEGYRAVLALAGCVLGGRTIPPSLMRTPDALYYPETLRLLSLSVVLERFSSCL